MIRYVSQDFLGRIVKKEVKDIGKTSFAEVHVKGGDVSGGGVGENREEREASGEGGEREILQEELTSLGKIG